MEAVILAGGLGTRLRSVVSEVPKCMAPVGGRPFLWYLLRQLERYGEGHVILSVGYLREVVKEWIRKEGSQFPFEYDFAEEETPLGTGGGIRLALEKARESETLVLNGDTLFDVDLEGLVAHHRAHPEHLITLALKEMKDFALRNGGARWKRHDHRLQREGVLYRRSDQRRGVCPGLTEGTSL